MDAFPVIELGFSLVGPGRVGVSLARWLTARGACLRQVAARHQTKAMPLAHELDATPVDLAQLESSGQDLILIAVADEALADVIGTLAARPQAAVALHVSGSNGAEILAPLRSAGCRIGTFHPLKAFPRASDDPEDSQGAVFAVDGEDVAKELASRLARSLGGSPIEVDEAARPLYHLAASLAAGGVVTLLCVADALAQSLGLPRQVTEAYFDLSQQALTLARRARHPAEALTGPVVRGDAGVVATQLSELEASVPHLLELVATLAEETQRQSAPVRGSESSHGELSRILAKAKEGKSFLDQE